ncbi:MAG TPA: AsmA-like C-terminal region-containing protein [Bacteroidales bacterium]|nr:AsmA-like C-terminal region-containing protein [Bacteroidales bacterium]
MKKILGWIIKILLGLVLLILVAMVTIPIIFKEKIREKVEEVINESVNAKIAFDDYKLGFFKNFPNLSFSLNGLSVVGVDKFENDTLVGFNSFSLVFNLSSLLGDSGYEVKSIVMDRAVINAIVLKDGTANWDIMKDTTTTEEVETDTTASTLKIVLQRVALLNTSLSYVDEQSDMKAYIKDLNFNLRGDMTLSETDLQMGLTIGEVSFIMEGLKYLNKAKIDSKVDLLANLDNMKFTFGENYFAINDLKINFKGMVSMPGDDIETDMEFGTPQTSFKTLLSLIPAVYMSDYQDLTTTGEFAFSGSAKGVYSDADSTLPDISLNLSINNGMISYPDLPEKIQNINLKSNVFVDGKDMDKTLANIDLFHMELAGSPFDMNFTLKTPMSDPDFSGSMIGKIDLGALMKAVPMDSINLSGIIDMSVKMAGKMSMIEKEQYESFTATGNMNIKDMLVAMIGYPEVKINNAGFEFTPAYAAMNNASLNIGGKSDFLFNGRIENYIPYVFSDQTIKGKLSMRSKLIDVGEIMSKMAVDTTVVEDTSALTVIQVPKNIDFEFDALINDFAYDSIKAQQVKGRIIVRDGILSLRETGMNILNGTILMNADYDTRDTLKPIMNADFDVRNIAVKDAFRTFNTVQKMAPMAKGIEGNINSTLKFSSLLGSDMMPVTNSINGSGKLQSDELTLVESGTFDKIKETLKLGDKYSNTFKNISISFRISDGRIYTSPFDIKTGNLKMNIAGDQGLDQTINYIVKTEMPRSDLGASVNSLIDNLSAQAAAYGVAYKPSETLKVNLKVTGTFTKPLISPFFGSTSGEGSGGGAKAAVKEVAKQTVEQAVDQGKDKARAEAEAQAAKLVQDAEEQGQRLRDEAARAATQIREEAENQAQNLVKEADGKGAIAKLAAQKGADKIRKTADTKAIQLEQEADNKAKQLVEEAKKKSDALINKI